LNSSVNLDNQAEVEFNTSGGSGGGLYLDSSSLYSDKASITNNQATGFGGGVYLYNDSVLDMDLGSYACVDHRGSLLNANSANDYGGGVYASQCDVDLQQTYVEKNSGDLGGGIYAYGSDGSGTVFLSNVVVARNNGQSRYDGIRLYGAEMTGSHVTVAYNDLAGAATGEAITTWNAQLTLSNSIIWGHTTSIDATGYNVTCSDIQGGYTGTGNVDVDPGFVSAAGQDYRLQLSSEAVDRCTGGSARDAENDHRAHVHVRPATPYDMGADEYVPDADNDGLSDTVELTVSCTEPDVADTDGDGILDGVEDRDGDGTHDLSDADTDDDGLLDGEEDVNQNIGVGADETDPHDADTDNDGLQDGTESGVSTAHADTGPGFQPDLDPSSTTDPRNPDTDGDGRLDGEEDRNQNGRVDAGETDPNVIDAPTLPIAVNSLLLLDE